MPGRIKQIPSPPETWIICYIDSRNGGPIIVLPYQLLKSLDAIKNPGRLRCGDGYTFFLCFQPVPFVAKFLISSIKFNQDEIALYLIGASHFQCNAERCFDEVLKITGHFIHFLNSRSDLGLLVHLK